MRREFNSRPRHFYFMSNNFLKATLTLSGVIIGVGTFAIPYAVWQAGILTGVIFLLGLGAIITLIHLMYGEIVLRTKEKHRLPGYIKKYLPSKINAIVSPIPIISLFGVLLIYLIVGGKFLSLLLEPLLRNFFPAANPAIYTLIFFAFGSLVILRDKNVFARAEVVFTLGLIVVALTIFIIGFPVFKLNNIDFSVFSLNKSFLVYGVIFFALTGLSAIPELREMFSDREGARFRKAIILGTFIPVVFYLIFMVAVIGISGNNVSEEAISGLGNILGGKILALGAALGFLATITSFWAVGLTLKKIFWYDYGMNKYAAWVVACFIPLIIYFMGVTSFIPVIEVIGGILGGIEGTILVAVYLRARKFSERSPEYSLNLPSLVYYCIPLLFILVIAYEFIY